MTGAAIILFPVVPTKVARRAYTKIFATIRKRTPRTWLKWRQGALRAKRRLKHEETDEKSASNWEEFCASLSGVAVTQHFISRPTVLNRSGRVLIRSKPRNPQERMTDFEREIDALIAKHPIGSTARESLEKLKRALNGNRTQITAVNYARKAVANVLRRGLRKTGL